jgi:hypothetical protein
LPNWVDEVLLVEGGPVDASFEAARRLADTPHLHEGETLRGGYSATTGEVVLVVDAVQRPSQEELSAFVLRLLGRIDGTAGQAALPRLEAPR